MFTLTVLIGLYVQDIMGDAPSRRASASSLRHRLGLGLGLSSASWYGVRASGAG